MTSRVKYKVYVQEVYVYTERPTLNDFIKTDTEVIFSRQMGVEFYREWVKLLVEDVYQHSSIRIPAKTHQNTGQVMDLIG